jgi:hypothetical protein
MGFLLWRQHGAFLHPVPIINPQFLFIKYLRQLEIVQGYDKKRFLPENTSQRKSDNHC